MRAITVGIIATALLAGLCGKAQAAIVWNNGLPNQTGGANMNDFLEADNFSLGSAANLNLVRFWSLQTSAADYTGSIEWSIRANNAGQPGAINFSGSASPTGAATGNTAAGLNEFLYEFAIAANLGIGDYWLVLHNGPSTSQPATSFFWAFTNDQAGTSESLELALGGGAVWTGNVAELAFQLESAAPDTQIPEPASLVLVGAGLAAVVVRRRYQGRRAA